MYTRWASAPPSAWRSWAKARLAWLGLTGVPLSAEDQVELDLVGWLAWSHPAQPEGRGLGEGQAETVLLAAVTA
jgi:hypothetical protein